jgi:dTDP-4-amino-4,6-dideoxygalactose transaminase
LINLFNIPLYKVDETKFDHPLHGSVVKYLEAEFASYVGAKYAVSFNSATSAIFLIAKYLSPPKLYIPSLIPPVVPNAIIEAGKTFQFTDNVSWVGDSYFMNQKLSSNETDRFNVIDSAQAVRKNQYEAEAINPQDLMIFSFYPTKPVGGRDGGMVVSNDRKKIEFLRLVSNNGMSDHKNSWERRPLMTGYKMYMDSYHAHVALKNLSLLDEKKEKLAQVRDYYNTAFELQNSSEHLYRVRVKQNTAFIQKALEAGIVCGIHYHACHNSRVYNNGKFRALPQSQRDCDTMVSIPFHEELSKEDQDYIIDFVKKSR